jgi:pRiA4b ORF-3-like protein
MILYWNKFFCAKIPSSRSVLQENPPEDCGGPYGFAELLDILRNPDHPEHEDRLEWLVDDFDSEQLDLTEIES